MNSYNETKDIITLTTTSVEVGTGSFVQLRIRADKNTNTRIVSEGVEYSIRSGDISPKLNGSVVVYKDSLESKVTIERSIYSLSSKIDNDESNVTAKTNPLTGRIEFRAGTDAVISSGTDAPNDADGKPDGSIYFQI